MIEDLARYGQTFLTDVLRLCLWLVILTIIFVPLERLFALRPQKILRPGIGVDLGYFFLNGIVPAILMSLPLSALAWTIHRSIPHEFHAAVAAAPLWSRILAGLIVGDIGYYWAHRCLHAVPVLWRFHAVHHSAPHIDFLVDTRAHPLDMTFGRLSGLVPLYALGLAGPAGAAGSAVPVVIQLVGIVWGFFIHANVRWRFGPLAWIVSTPHFHHWHHTNDAPLSRNYASLLPWLDRLFGTHHLPKGQYPSRYGIHDSIPATLGEQLIQPFLGRRASPAE